MGRVVCDMSQKSRVWLQCPREPTFEAHAKRLGGDFSRLDGMWKFDPRVWPEVRQHLLDIFGEDGIDEPMELVCLLVYCSNLPTPNPLYVAGRELARRYERDRAVALGVGVGVREGGFAKTAGSRAKPELGCEPGTVLTVRDVPRRAADVAQSQWPNAIEILTDHDTHLMALQDERQRLERRLAEVTREIEAARAGGST